ncbi:MAG TPA: HIRAN domain-containing protein [Rhodocyclaceae bacterium]|nr:HIRAN domain-containing protein [Rhodocyclaceae bacterium]
MPRLFALCLFSLFALGDHAAHAQAVRILIQSSPLAGYQYHAGNELWEQLQTGDTLTLVREPDNPHDRNAVRVEWQGQQLGYLPRAENQAIAVELDRGGRVEARIARLREARNPWQRILIDVFIRI